MVESEMNTMRLPEKSVEAGDVVVSIDNITKTYGGPGGILALEETSMQIRDCEFVSLIGPSGCGKSTLLRIVGGLIPYVGDAVTVLGRKVVSPLDEIGIVFQNANLLPWRTVVGNLRLGIEAGGARPADLDERIDSMIELLGLGGFEKRYPHELSGGMQQRVAIGQALIRNPRILLMDEPFGALDALTRDRMNIELLRIWEAQRKTVLLVTHSVVESVFLSDRVLVMSERPGRIIEDLRIDLPHPRDPKATRAAKVFGEYVVHLTELLGVI